jgi:hypothetical protein
MKNEILYVETFSGIDRSVEYILYNMHFKGLHQENDLQ